MILDSSCLIAVFLKEPGFEKVLEALLDGDALGIGAPTLTETTIVLTARIGDSALGLVRHFVDEFDVSVIAYGELHWREAHSAFLRFGKGRHPASLNFGDCMSYATARVAARPLLCLGNDFPKTDLEILQPHLR